MEIELIKRFTIECISCETQTTVSLQDAQEYRLNEYQCPVCKENLSFNVSQAMEVIRAYNQVASRVLQMLEDGVISVESD